jgi:multiple sugar transport system substrate-binding protein
MKRFICSRSFRPFAVLAVIAMVIGLGAPALSVAAQEKETVTYFTFSAAPDHLEDIAAMEAAFEAANPNIDVKIETAAYADYFTELQTRIAGGDAPDSFELNYENFVSYASKGVLADLTTYAAADPAFADAYYPKAYEAFQVDGVQYGLPASFSDVVLFYNKEAFDAAGVAYPTADWTWKEETDAAAKLTDAGNDIWGMYSPITFHEFYKTAAQNGCGFFGEDGSVTINQPACVEALQFMIDAQNNGYQPSDADMAGVPNEDVFKAGQLGMFTSGIWMFPLLADAPFEWDIAVEPGNTQKATHFFANGATVSAESEHQDAAFKWISFLTSSPEAAKIRVDASWELPALQDQALFDSYLTQTPPASRNVVFDSLEYAVTPPVIEKQQQMQDAVNALLDQVKSGDLTPQEALDQAKTEIEALIA